MNYNQNKRSLHDNGDVMVVQQFPTVAEIMSSPMPKYITHADNYCGYSGTEEMLILNYVHLFYFKDNPSAS